MIHKTLNGANYTKQEKLLWSAFDYTSSYYNVGEEMSINGVTGTLIHSYYGENASPTLWTTNDISGAMVAWDVGAAPTQQFTPLTDPRCSAMRFAFGQSFRINSGSDVGQITTEDMIVEMLFRNGTGTSTVVGKKSNPGTGAGWCLNTVSSATNIRFTVSDNTTVAIATNATPNQSSWHNVLAFRDADEHSTDGGIIYVNGVAGAGVDLSITGSLSSSFPFGIGAAANSTQNLAGDVAFVRVWKKQDWFPGGGANKPIMDKIAKQRHLRIAGAWPSVNTANSDMLFNSSSPQAWFLDRAVSGGILQQFPMGQQWPRLQNTFIGQTPITGILVEPVISNLIADSIGIKWEVSGGTTVENIDYGNYFTSKNADLFRTSALSGTHFMTQNRGGDANGPHTFSVFLKQVTGSTTTDFAYLFVSGVITGCNNGLMFNLTNGTIGSYFQSPAGKNYITGTMQPYGYGYHRCSITFTGSATVHSLRIGMSKVDWLGNGTQTEQFIAPSGSEGFVFTSTQFQSDPFATSLIPCAGFTGANGEFLRFNISSGSMSGNIGRIEMDFATPKYTNSIVGSSLYSVGSFRDNFLMTAGQQIMTGSWTKPEQKWVLTGSTISDMFDGTKHNLQTHWNNSKASLYIDGNKTDEDLNISPLNVTSSDSFLTIGNSQWNQPAAWPKDHLLGMTSNIYIYDKKNKI